MSFVTWPYPFFLATVAAMYWALPLKGRWWLLLVSSYGFYAAWDPRFLALLLSSTAIDYFCGRGIVDERRPWRHVIAATALPALWLGTCRLVNVAAPGFPGLPQVDPRLIGVAALLPAVFLPAYALLWRWSPLRRRKGFVAFSVISNLAVLGFFKYFNFFSDSLRQLLHALGASAHWDLPTIVLPVAISFYTFQSISYAVDIARGQGQPARQFVLFAAYLAFFPQLIAGPIERVGRFLPQFETARAWSRDHLHQGLALLLTGLFKKVFVADNCALLTNHVFDPKTPLDAPWALLGAVAFAFQIYGDFSGYTDLARGSARLLGIELSSNFRFPYSARGPSDFWQRWHRTLSTWFRDYLYIPLGGNRRSLPRQLANLWIVMLLAGLWHGANWNFLLWGGYHAALLTLYRVVPPLGRLERATSVAGGWLATASMFAFTLFGWVLFRCANLEQLGHWFGAWTRGGAVGDATAMKPALWLALHVAPLLLLQWATRRDQDERANAHWPWPARGLAYAALVLALVASSSQDQEFLYFQF
ncbi:MAG: MBOAT family protein [Verrucomicrobia bacterium]|nr:MBOAT family protein [Verrucomicrobiota bacterium]MBI3868919.1 MBOAT family protein [Verrucomicrobiota bacterium]